MQSEVRGRTESIVLLIDLVLQGRQARKRQDPAKEGERQPQHKERCRDGPAKLCGHPSTCRAWTLLHMVSSALPLCQLI